MEWRKLPADASAIFLPDFCRAVAPESFLPMRAYKVKQLCLLEYLLPSLFIMSYRSRIYRSTLTDLYNPNALIVNETFKFLNQLTIVSIFPFPPQSIKSLDGMHLSNSRERPLARLPSGELVRSAHGGYQDPQLSQHGGPSSQHGGPLSQHGGGSPLHRTPTTSTHKSIPITPPRTVGTYSRSGSGGSSRDSSRHDNNLSPQSSLHGRNRYLTYPPS